MKNIWYYLGVALLLASFGNGQAIRAIRSTNASAPVVDLGYVKYQGYTNATIGINYFRAIPYVCPG